MGAPHGEKRLASRGDGVTVAKSRYCGVLSDSWWIVAIVCLKSDQELICTAADTKVRAAGESG